MHKPLPLLLCVGLAAGCVERDGPLEPPQAKSPDGASLSLVSTASGIDPVEDALHRLTGHLGPAADQLRAALAELTDASPRADAAARQQRLALANRSLDRLERSAGDEHAADLEAVRLVLLHLAAAE